MFGIPSISGLVEKAVSYQRSSQYVNVASLALFLADYLQTFELERCIKVTQSQLVHHSGKDRWYVNVASLALFLADYLQTFELEVSLIWERDWRAIKVLYAVSRYIPFAYLPVALFVGLQENPTVSKCSAAFASSSLLIVTGMMVAEVIMFIRVHALSGHSKALAVWLGLQFVAVHAAIYAIFALFVKSTKFLPYQIGTPGCIPYRFDTTQLSAVFGIIVASESVLMLITAYLGIRSYRMSDSALLVVFYQDGAVYFISLAAVTVGNIIFDLVGPAELRFMLAVPQGVLHSILSCRMIVHMYDFGRKEVMGGTHGTGTALEFATVGDGNRNGSHSANSGNTKRSSDGDAA